MPEKKVYSLFNLTQSIQNVINTYCNKTVWIKAEIVRLNYYPKSGHCYPSLVEKKDGKVIAELRGNIWSGNFEMINTKFKSVLKEELKDNITVVIQGTVSYHPLHGLALNIVDIDPEFTLGELAREKAETIAKLKETGVFNANKNTLLSNLPKTIAIISVETSKGYGDFMDIIQNNPWGYKFHFLLFPAILQGERAVSSISQQLERIKKHKKIFDAVAIIRGGGGEIGLSSFDNYLLAEKIATFPIPILTGIGHSANETVSELVSYQSFITPTKIAEFLLQKFHDFAIPVKDAEQKIQNEVSRMFKNEKINLKETARLFSSLTGNAMNNSRSNLNQLAAILDNLSHRSINDQKNMLHQAKRSILSNAKNTLNEAVANLSFTEEKIRMLSPLNILKRGFSITRQNGKVIRNADEIQKDLLLETQLYKGNLYSRIEKIDKKTKND
ncbi:exodeoxyribonuclease VII large subunit [Gillisia limnaea]|uniref:Exodeoxyribonuclease 7 large subunit n=1 Tax=Gillisia limnaea (strain DSM 15749 / LMG 21470 / R-8282) TaxID=865937 RepID=H2BVN9_GILLR|nr:exodeoxyribonuclease VII large subunit [Gillisia limnaea]EHQ03995.1 Exonuclease VII, large subunit [Gillisia limnaea DSM 15749]